MRRHLVLLFATAATATRTLEQLFVNPNDVVSDSTILCDKLDQNEMWPGIRCGRKKDGSYFVTYGSNGMGIQMKITNDGKHFMVFKNCQVLANGTHTICSPEHLVSPTEEPIVTVFWKKPFLAPLIASEAALTQRFHPEPFTKEVLRASRLAQLQVIPDVYEIYNLGYPLVKHDMQTMAYCMGFFPGTTIASLKLWPTREAANVTSRLFEEWSSLLGDTHHLGLSETMQQRITELMRRATAQTTVHIRQHLTFMKTWWYFAASMWHRGLVHCDFHGGNIMATTQAYDLSATQQLEHADLLSRSGLINLKPEASRPIWDASQRQSQPKTTELGKVQTTWMDGGSLLHFHWKAIDPAYALDMQDQLVHGVNARSLANPCGFYRSLNVEDVNHLFTSTEKSFELIDKSRKSSP
eukprot:Gregarina_sp_Poly_1__10306@NODE_727_length_6572_cov_47_111145_g545_i0_p2_GENE_NODE_727_length_6572_cov_47_111145_g545_i0NODE_727_length_6572_cov_47_111145_g545_i0_p2_ORF_typecomplete_len410_score44_10APH/PF01636_23/3_6e06APH_6_hur/PF04655_14/0_033APH_6_hur/PF04655_14/7_5e03Pkinase_fungal/PF17667_1/0_059RIO1/PF01163_22/0_14_NODE_727_length_6572_cov_47_111145_g545_i08522081